MLIQVSESLSGISSLARDFWELDKLKTNPYKAFTADKQSLEVQSKLENLGHDNSGLRFTKRHLEIERNLEKKSRRKKANSQQHPMFQGGHPSKYWVDSTLLNFSDRTRTDVFNVIWPLASERAKSSLFQSLVVLENGKEKFEASRGQNKRCDSPAASSVPRRSPIQVLTGLNIA